MAEGFVQKLGTLSFEHSKQIPKFKYYRGSLMNINIFLKTSIVYSVLQAFMFIFYSLSYTPPWLFSIFIIILYISSKPRFMLSPRNMVFAYYLLWYGIAPQFATRFSDYQFTTKEENIAYLMLFATYGIMIVLLTLFETLFSQRKIKINSDKYNNNIKRVYTTMQISFLFTVVFLILFIIKSGGIHYWISDPTMAYIQRRGAGIYYLLFTHSFMVYCISLGFIIYIKKNLKLMSFHFLTIIILFPFIGSKAKVILLFLITISFFIINKKSFSKLTLGIVVVSFLLFTIGIYQRNMSWMKLVDFIPYALNYFNTLEMFLITIRDFEPSFLKTFLLPFNKILLYFGEYINVPFYDMSVWLTSMYYPNAHAISATEQWPIEADMYLSFYFILGIPFLAIYLCWLGYAFNKAQEGYLSWLLIYVIEFVLIITHLRGGLFLWGYFYYIPFFILVLIIFKDIRMSTDKENITS